MNILPGILCFLNIVDTIFKVKDKVFKPVDRDGISSLLKSIGELLSVVADELEAGRYPHSRCQEMWHYLDDLKAVLNPVLTDPQIVHLTEQIAASYRIEQLAGQLQSIGSSIRAENLLVLRAASGSFTALSNLVKIK